MAHSTFPRSILFIAPLLTFLCLPIAAADSASKKIVLIAGPITGHPKDTHEYEKSVILLKNLLDTAPNVKGIRTEAHFRGWPRDPMTLDDAERELIRRALSRSSLDENFLEKRAVEAIGQMLRHRPGANTSSAGATGISTFQNACSPIVGSRKSRPTRVTPTSQTVN